MTKEEWYKQLFERLANSKFRSSFHLKQKDIDYINEKEAEAFDREFPYMEREKLPGQIFEGDIR